MLSLNATQRFADMPSSGSIELANGSLFDSGAEVLVNPVNCVGVMGAGLALEFRRLFPEYYRAYGAACRARRLRLGTVHLYHLSSEETVPRIIVSFPTKGHQSRLSDIDAGLADMADRLRVVEPSIRSAAVPALGCGLGGLSWADVRPVMVRRLRGLAEAGVTVVVYEPTV
ncbi:MAG: macro domain-containing protein [Actinobacteria bacterium]|nr:macro domain-containing protein [Actinomycetota bacterium]